MRRSRLLPKQYSLVQLPRLDNVLLIMPHVPSESGSGELHVSDWLYETPPVAAFRLSLFPNIFHNCFAGLWSDAGFAGAGLRPTVAV